MNASCPKNNKQFHQQRLEKITTQCKAKNSRKQVILLQNLLSLQTQQNSQLQTPQMKEKTPQKKEKTTHKPATRPLG